MVLFFCLSSSGKCVTEVIFFKLQGVDLASHILLLLVCSLTHSALLTWLLLLLQVLSICKLLSKSGVPFRSMVVTGGFRQRTQLENLRQELDVLIATPGRFLFLMKEGFLQLSNLKWYILIFFFSPKIID